jgi:acyl carrier protein
MPTTLEKVLTIAKKHSSVNSESLSESTELSELGLDSLDIVEFTMSVEDEFGISISDEDVPNFKTIGDFVKHVEEKKS